MGVSDFAVFGVFGLFNRVPTLIIPIAVIVLLVKILGRLDEIARRLDAGGSIAPRAGSPQPDRPIDTRERG